MAVKQLVEVDGITVRLTYSAAGRAYARALETDERAEVRAERNHLRDFAPVNYGNVRHAVARRLAELDERLTVLNAHMRQAEQRALADAEASGAG